MLRILRIFSTSRYEQRQFLKYFKLYVTLSNLDLETFYIQNLWIFHQNSTNFRILQPKFPRHPLVLKAAVQHRDLFFKTFVHRVVRVCPSNSSLRFPNYLGHTKDRKVALVESGRALTHSRVLVTTGFSFLL